MKKLLSIGFLGVLMVFVAVSAMASVYDGPYSGNDSESALELLYGPNIDLLAKYDDIEKGGYWNPGPNGFSVTLTNFKSGTWSYTGGYISGYKALYVVVKGGPQYKVYKLNPFDFSQNYGPTAWDTVGLLNPGGKQPDVSHISFYGKQVPLPASAFLMGSALLGLFGIRRAREKK